MQGNNRIILAAKCIPERGLLADVHKAGIEAVELYLTGDLLRNISDTIQMCRSFPLRYAVHAPNDDLAIDELVRLTESIPAEVVVFHDNFWEDEWPEIIEKFKRITGRLCVENTASVQDSVKLLRRYGIGRCLDFEHLQMEGAGIFEEGFLPIIKEADHIHLTGYKFGSTLWHTHIHHSTGHSLYIFDLIKKAGYSGFVVSEAKSSLQTYDEFKKLKDFFLLWQSKQD